MYEYRMRVLAVHDGDTALVDVNLGFDFEWKRRAIRLAGIDAPELTKKIGGKVVVQADGENATLALLELLGGRALFAAKRTRPVFGTPGDYLVTPGPDLVVEGRTHLDPGAPELEKYGRVLTTVWVGRDSLDHGPSLSDRMVAGGHAIAKVY